MKAVFSAIVAKATADAVTMKRVISPMVVQSVTASMRAGRRPSRWIATASTATCPRTAHGVAKTSGQDASAATNNHQCAVLTDFWVVRGALGADGEVMV